MFKPSRPNAAASRPTANWLVPFCAERVANRLDLNAIYVGSSSAHSGSRNKAEKLLQLRSPDLQPVALQSLDTSHELNAGALSISCDVQV